MAEYVIFQQARLQNKVQSDSCHVTGCCSTVWGCLTSSDVGTESKTLAASRNLLELHFDCSCASKELDAGFAMSGCDMAALASGSTSGRTFCDSHIPKAISL